VIYTSSLVTLSWMLFKILKTTDFSLGVILSSLKRMKYQPPCLFSGERPG
jgi:hypothetical protein